MTASKPLGRVHSVESFGLVDGPGVRYVIFLQGCALRCQFCHNPDSWEMHNPSAEMTDAESLLEQALRYRKYWGRDGKKGGITVSGGEPMLQMPFVTELFELAHRKGVHTTLDTAGQPYREDTRLSEAVRYVREALTVCPYITGAAAEVVDFDGSTLRMRVSLTTVYGEASIHV